MSYLFHLTLWMPSLDACDVLYPSQPGTLVNWPFSPHCKRLVSEARYLPSREPGLDSVPLSAV